MKPSEKLFERFLVFVYHCFDRIVIPGYMPLLTRPEHMVHFFRDVHGQYPITPLVLAKRTLEYRGGVEGYARNHKIPVLKSERRYEARRIVSCLICNGWSGENQHEVYFAFSRAWKWAAHSVRKYPGAPPTIRTTASSGASGRATCTVIFTSAIW